MKTALKLVFVVLILTGCATNKNWYSYEYSTNDINKIAYKCREKAKDMSFSPLIFFHRVFALVGAMSEQKHYEECCIAYGLISEEKYLGDKYFLGDGVQQDFKKAMDYYLVASDQGYAEASAGIAAMYYDGAGVERDLAKSKEWRSKAIEQGYVYKTQNNIKVANEQTDRESLQKTLIGTWKSNQENYEATITYYENGIFNSQGNIITRNGKKLIVVSGKWEIKNNLLVSTFTASNIPEVIPVGFQYIEEIIEIKDDKLTTKDPKMNKIDTSYRVQ